MRRSIVAVAASLSCAAAFAADPPAPDRGQMRALAKTCQPDAERFCPNVEKGGGRKLMCLREHGSELTPACRDGLAQLQAIRKGDAK
jgi:hypothetical protein